MKQDHVYQVWSDPTPIGHGPFSEIARPVALTPPFKTLEQARAAAERFRHTSVTIRKVARVRRTEHRRTR